MRLVSARSRVRSSLEAVRVGVVGNISACHADAPGSIPGRGDFFFWCPEAVFRVKTLLLICFCFFLSVQQFFFEWATIFFWVCNIFFFWCERIFFWVCNKQSSTNNAYIGQLAEHLLRKEKVTSSILVGGWQFAWSSWLWRSPHTREVPSSSLGANTTKIFANKFFVILRFFCEKNPILSSWDFFFPNIFTLRKKKSFIPNTQFCGQRIHNLY